MSVAVSVVSNSRLQATVDDIYWGRRTSRSPEAKPNELRLQPGGRAWPHETVVLYGYTSGPSPTNPYVAAETSRTEVSRYIVTEDWFAPDLAGAPYYYAVETVDELEAAIHASADEGLITGCAGGQPGST